MPSQAIVQVNGSWFSTRAGAQCPPELTESNDWLIQGCACTFCQRFRQIRNYYVSDVAQYIETSTGLSRTEINEMTYVELVDKWFGARYGESIHATPNVQFCDICSRNGEGEGRHLVRNVVYDENDNVERGCCTSCWTRPVVHCPICYRVGHATNDENGMAFHQSRMMSGGSAAICTECGENHDLQQCTFCANTFAADLQDYVVTEDGETYCSNCETHTFWCAICDCVYGHDQRYNLSSGSLCSICYDEHGEYCDQCDRYYTEDIDCGCISTVLRRYSYKPIPIFHWDKDKETYGYMLPPIRGGISKIGRNVTLPVFYGVELECNFVGGSRSRATKDFVDVFNKALTDVGATADGIDRRTPFLYAKSDTTVNGAEFVTHPFTYAWLHKYIGIWEQCVNMLSDLGFRANDQDAAGMHVHISKHAFTSLGLYKLLRFLYGNPFVAERIAGRTNRNMITYGNVYAETSQSIKNIARSKTAAGGRGVAVYCGNSNTVEIRMFQGVHTFDKFMHNMEFCESIVQFCREVGLVNVRPDQYVKFLEMQGTKFDRILRTVSSNKL